MSFGEIDLTLEAGQTVAIELQVYSAASASDNAPLLEHIANATPHPVYDDLPSFTLLFENGLL